MGLAVIFPGQGTQAPGMGAPWVAHPAWELVERAEAGLGESLAGLLIDAPPETLARTREAQLAVLLNSLVTWEALRPTLPPDTEIVAFAGHSLGQVTALIAAGVLPLDDGVRLAATRAEVTQAAADRHPGKMAALLGATEEQANDACTAAPDACWVANDNAPGQVVIAGTPEGLEAACERARAIGIRKVMALNVGGAFHTPLMDEARDDLIPHLDKITFATPTAAVISNIDGLAYNDADGWRERLADQLVRPVRWRTCMETITSLGATSCIEVGRGEMLAGLAKRITPDLAVRGVSSPDDIPLSMEVR